MPVDGMQDLRICCVCVQYPFLSISGIFLQDMLTRSTKQLNKAKGRHFFFVFDERKIILDNSWVHQYIITSALEYTKYTETDLSKLYPRCE
jgi:hypothetical protein